MGGGRKLKKPLGLSRCVSLPERFSFAGGRIARSRGMEEEVEEEKKIAGIRNGLTTMSEDSSENAEIDMSGSDWWRDPPSTLGGHEDPEKGFELVWNDITQDCSLNNESFTSRTNEDWWDVREHEGAALKRTQSFVSSLYVIWDEDGEKDPFIYVGEGPCDELNDSMKDGALNGAGARSVFSEPENMGRLEDSFATSEEASDPTRNRWLMAWDDLALL